MKSTSILSLCLPPAIALAALGCGGGGGGTSNNTPVTTDSAPKIVADVKDQTVVMGSNATFSFAVDGNPAPVFQWMKGGKQIVGQTSSTFNLANVQMADDGATYSVIASNSLGSVTSRTATLHVTAPAGSFVVRFDSPIGGTIAGVTAQAVTAGGAASSVTAVPDNSSIFQKWVLSDGTESTANPLTISNVQKDLTCTAVFAGSEVGEAAADVSGIDSNGNSVKLSDDAGSVMVLDVSAQWCPHCQDDASLLEQLNATYGPKGVKVVTILCEDNSNQICSQAVLQAWVSLYGLSYRVQNDGSGAAKGIAATCYAGNPVSGGFPTFVVIDKHFVVQYVAAGYDAPGIKAVLDKLLAQ